MPGGAPQAPAVHAAVGTAAGRSLPVLSPAMASFTLTLMMGLQPITTDIMVPALPALAADLAAPLAPVQMTMSALILAFGLAQLVWGPVADRVGRRPVLLAALALYTLASLGALLATQVGQVVVGRAAQGAAMSAVVVCGRAMVRDLYPPHEGVMVMARALTWLSLIAVASPLLGGALVGAWGWRGAIAAMAVAGAAVGAYVLWRVPESARELRPEATQPGPLLRQAVQVLRHPAFRAWALLVAFSYGGIFIFLSTAGFVLISVMRLSPWDAGLITASCPLTYMLGTMLCRRWIPRHGLPGTAARAAGFTLAASIGFALVALTDWRHPLAVMLPVWLYSAGHGLNNPCGQTGAVAPFPQAAGLASALAGFVTAAVAFGIGLWLGPALDGTVRPFAWGMAATTLASATMAWTLVRRDGHRLDARASA